MTRSHAGTERGRTRRRHRIASLAGLVAFLCATLVTVAAPAAHALSPCLSTDASCPVANDIGTGVPGGDIYKTPFNVKLTVNATPSDPAHDMGLMAHDRGPAATTRIELAWSDTQSWNGATITYTNNLNGSFTYTPDPKNPYSGIDQFDYSIIDTATGIDDTGTAYVDVIASAHNDVYGTRLNTALNVTQPGAVPSPPTLVANDLGVDPDTITLDTASAHGGTITDNLDGAFQYVPPTGFQGIDTFGYTVMDIDWDYTYSATVTIYVDGTPPLVAMATLPTVTLGTTTTPRWSGSDNVGVANYDVQYQIAAWNAGFGAWTNWRMATTATSSAFAGAYGRTFCFRARARDHVGNVSAFTTPHCTSTPIRAFSISHSSLWSRTANAAYFSGQAIYTRTKGQNAGMAGVQAKRVWLIATKCSTCGTVQVRWNNVVIANVNLASATTVRHALFQIVNFTAPKAGTLQLYVTSPNGKSVIVEGLSVLRA